MKIKFDIKSYLGTVLFTYEADTLREAVQQAVKSGADLYGADLSRAKLSGADLSRAKLYGADLSRANLSGADLSRAKLSRADIKELKNAELSLLRTSIVPQVGQFVGWKKCNANVIVKLMVGKNARRSNAHGRKCRADYVKVLEVIGSEIGLSLYDGKTEYRVGKIVRCDAWNEDRWTECGGGIHFYLTREEAEGHQ